MDCTFDVDMRLFLFQANFMEKTYMEPYCLNSLDAKQENMKENKTNFKSISMTIISKYV